MCPIFKIQGREMLQNIFDILWQNAGDFSVFFWRCHSLEKHTALGITVNKGNEAEANSSYRESGFVLSASAVYLLEKQMLHYVY